MSPKAFFRMLVALSLAIAFANAALAFWPPESPDEWSAVLEWQGNGGIFEHLPDLISDGGWKFWVGILLTLVMVTLVAAVQVGMFLFWRPARLGYAALAALSLVLVLFGGLVVTTPVVATLDGIVLVLDGVIIAMSYLPPIAIYFEPIKA